MAAGLPGPPGGCVGGRPGHGIARVRVARSVLDRHAAWMADDVAFATTVDGTPVVAMPYYWYHDGRSANRAPAMTAYELMTVDGLAAAYEHTGTVRYLTVAGQLFDGAILYPFGTGWTPFVYSTINEAGKFRGARPGAAPARRPTPSRVARRTRSRDRRRPASAG